MKVCGQISKLNLSSLMGLLKPSLMRPESYFTNSSPQIAVGTRMSLNGVRSHSASVQVERDKYLTGLVFSSIVISIVLEREMPAALLASVIYYELFKYALFESQLFHHVFLTM